MAIRRSSARALSAAERKAAFNKGEQKKLTGGQRKAYANYDKARTGLKGALNANERTAGAKGAASRNARVRGA